MSSKGGKERRRLKDGIWEGVFKEPYQSDPVWSGDRSGVAAVDAHVENHLPDVGGRGAR